MGDVIICQCGCWLDPEELSLDNQCPDCGETIKSHVTQTKSNAAEATYRLRKPVEGTENKTKRSRPVPKERIRRRYAPTVIAPYERPGDVHKPDGATKKPELTPGVIALSLAGPALMASAAFFWAGALVMAGIFSLVLIPVNFLGIALIRQELKVNNLLRTTKARRIRKLRIGQLTKLEGRIVAHESLLTSPFGNHACVYHYSSVEDRVPSNDRESPGDRQLQSFLDVRSVRCLLEDSSGQIDLDLPNADVFPVRRDSTPPNPDPAPIVKKSKERTYLEQVLKDGDRVSVLGTVWIDEETQRLRLERNPFLRVVQGEAALDSHERNLVLIGSVIALLNGGLAFAAWFQTF